MGAWFAGTVDMIEEDQALPAPSQPGGADWLEVQLEEEAEGTNLQN